MIKFFVFIGVIYSLMNAGVLFRQWLDKDDAAAGIASFIYFIFGAFGIYALIVGK